MLTVFCLPNSAPLHEYAQVSHDREGIRLDWTGLIWPISCRQNSTQLLLFLADFNVRWNNKLDWFFFYLAVIQFHIIPHFFFIIAEDLYLFMLHWPHVAIATSFLILRSAALFPGFSELPCLQQNSHVLPWHTFQHSIWHGTALNRQNIEQYDIVCKSFYNITGHSQPHWWINPISVNQISSVELCQFIPGENCSPLLTCSCYSPSPHLIFLDMNRRSHGKETASSVMSHWSQLNNSQYQKGE